MDTVVGECWWYLLMLLKKIDIMTSSLSLFPSFFVGASPMFFEIKSNNPVVAQSPPFLLVKISGFCGLHSSFAWVLVLVTPSRPWLPSRVPFQDVDTTGLWGKRGRPAASARRKQKRQTWRRRAERWRNLEYHLLLSIYRDTLWLCQNSYWKWP